MKTGQAIAEDLKAFRDKVDAAIEHAESGAENFSEAELAKMHALLNDIGHGVGHLFDSLRSELSGKIELVAKDVAPI